MGSDIFLLNIGTVLGSMRSLAVRSPELLPLISSSGIADARHATLFDANAELWPFGADTEIPSIWAYNAALRYTTPGSCLEDVPLPVLGRLEALQFHSSNNTQEFAWNADQEPFASKRGRTLFVGWVNQINTPKYTRLNVTGKGRGNARIPDSVRGFTMAGIVPEEFKTLELLSWATLAGPVLIDV